jgi:LPS-assembly protein
MKKTALIIFLICCFSFTNTDAEESKTTISADHLKYESKQQIYHLKGNVKIKKEDASIEADSAEYFSKSGKAVVSGDIRYEDRDILIEAEEANINLITKKGVLYNSHLLFKKDNYHVRGDTIERIDEKNYLIRKGTYTTCDAPLPAWCFKAGRTEVTVGERLKAENVVFKIKDRPVLYLPALTVPIGTERKSGLLWPRIGFQSDKGAYWSQPFYLVLSGNRDATINLDYYSRRGFGEGLEYRYVEQFGTGEWWIYHIRDRDMDKNLVEFKGRHRYLKEGSLSGFLNLNLVNEKNYYREYSHKVEVRTSRFLESTGELYYPVNNGRVYIQGRFFQDLKNSTGDISQRLPGLGLSLYPVKKGPLYLSIDTSYSNYHSDNLYKVHRFDIYPSLYHTMGNSIRLSQTLGLRETAYLIDNSVDYPNSVSRESFDYNLRLHTRLTRGYKRFRHILEPEIEYTYIPHEEDDMPLLDSTELYSKTSIMELALRNYFISNGERFLTFRVSGVFDFDRDEREFSTLKYESFLEKPFNLKMDASFEPNSPALQTFNYSTTFKVSRVDLSFGQRYTRENDILVYTGGISIPLTSRLTIDSSVWYDGKGGGMREHKVIADYTAQCWGVRLTYNKRPDDYSLFLSLGLKGLGSVSF